MSRSQICELDIDPNLKSRHIHDIFASPSSPNISPSPASPHQAPPREGEKAPRGHMGGNNRALVTLSSHCLHKILPLKSLKGASKTSTRCCHHLWRYAAKKVQSDFSESVSFHGSTPAPPPGPPLPLLKTRITSWSLKAAFTRTFFKLSLSALNFTFHGGGQKTHNKYCGEICSHHIWRTLKSIQFGYFDAHKMLTQFIK